MDPENEAKKKKMEFIADTATATCQLHSAITVIHYIM